MRQTPARIRSIATVLGLLTASVTVLCAGALLAVGREGAARLLLAGGGFGGYLYFFAHALREIALPRVLLEERPDPERRTLAPEPTSSSAEGVEVPGPEAPRRPIAA